MSQVKVQQEVVPEKVYYDRGAPHNFTHENSVLKIGADFWYALVLSFLLAATCSAFNQLAFGKKQKKVLTWLASSVCFGMISVLSVCLIWGSDIHVAEIVAISIASGFCGESLIGIVAKFGINFLPVAKDIPKQNTEDETKKTK